VLRHLFFLCCLHFFDHRVGGRDGDEGWVERAWFIAVHKLRGNEQPRVCLLDKAIASGRFGVRMPAAEARVPPKRKTERKLFPQGAARVISQAAFYR